MKIFNILIIGIVVVWFSGCADKCPPPPEPIVKIVYKTKIVKVEVPCKIPAVHCDFSGDRFEPSKKAMMCVELQKRALEVCSGQLSKVGK
jgi:hypothetical protein